MSKTTLFLALAVVAGAAAFFFLRDAAEVDRGKAYPERVFAVPNRDAVARIFIADMAGRTMDFRRRGDGRWLINDSVEASPTIMQQMTATLEQLRIDHTPTRATAETQREHLASSALKVEAFDEAGEKLTGVLIGASVDKGAGSYMVVDGYDDIFAVRRGMLTGTVRPQFDLRSIASLRSKSFIAYDPADIRSVEVRYPSLPSRSFRVARDGGDYEVESLAEVVAAPGAAPQPRLVEGYLEAFAQVPLSAWANDYPVRDSISRMTPFAQLIVETTSARDTFELQPDARFNEQGQRDQSAPFSNYWVERGRRDFVIVQDHQIQPLLRTYQSFFQ